MPFESAVREAPSLIDLDLTFLPVGQMRQISRINSVEQKIIEGEMDLGPEHWVFPQHFPGDPIFPGTLLIEAAGQLVALWAWWQGQRGRPRLVRTSAEFVKPVGLDAACLVLKGVVQRKRNLYVGSVEVLSCRAQVAQVEARLVVLPPESEAGAD
jgi:3-hydroxymyristoyl/3-hydroxydecanoyl-(acyl carrier protein) dehydratase